MFNFENSEYLYLLIGVIPLILLAYFAEKNRRANRKKFIDSHLFERIVPKFNTKSHLFRNIIIIAVYILVTVALANPQWSGKKEKVKILSSDIFIALDISRSMMSQDIAPNRLERSKKFVSDLIDKLKGNRIGLIFFAGDAFLKMPLTSDYAAAKMFVKSAAPSLIENQGTAITEALSIAEKGFDEEENHQRAMIVISDGEDHDGDAIEKTKKVAEKGLVTFTVGVGTQKGGFVPYIDRYGLEKYKKDENGEFVKTVLNEKLLKDIAYNGKGKYHSILEGDNALNTIQAQLEKIKKREVEQRSFKKFDSYYQYFLLVAILLLIIQFFISEKIKKS